MDQRFKKRVRLAPLMSEANGSGVGSICPRFGRGGMILIKLLRALVG